MTTDKCASTIAEGKHGDFAEQNHVNASLGSYFPCLCAHLFRNDIDCQRNSSKPYRSNCIDIYICLSISQSQVYWQSYTFWKSFSEVTPFTDLQHMTLHTHPRTHTHTLTHTHTYTHAHTLAQLRSIRYAVFTVSKHYSMQIYTYTDNGITVSEV